MYPMSTRRISSPPMSSHRRLSHHISSNINHPIHWSSDTTSPDTKSSHLILVPPSSCPCHLMPNNCIQTNLISCHKCLPHPIQCHLIPSHLGSSDFLTYGQFSSHHIPSVLIISHFMSFRPILKTLQTLCLQFAHRRHVHCTRTFFFSE